MCNGDSNLRFYLHSKHNAHNHNVCTVAVVWDTAKELRVSEVVCCIVSVFMSVQHTLGVCTLYSTDECRLVQQDSSVNANGHDNSYV